MGRKPLSDTPKSATPLRILLTEAERARIDTAATAAGKKTSTWARDVLLDAAGDARPPAKKSPRKR